MNFSFLAGMGATDFINATFPWILSCFTIWTFFLAGDQNRHTWRVGLVSQVFWMTWIYTTGSWGLIPGNVGLTIVFIRNELKRLRELAASQQASAIPGNASTIPFVMIPVAGKGVLLVRRDIDPDVKLSFPGGGVHREGETWQEAAIREVYSDTGLAIRNLRIVDMVTIGGKQNLLFAESDPIEIADGRRFAHGDHVREVIIAADPRELSSPNHTEQMQAFFRRHLGVPRKVAA